MCASDPGMIYRQIVSRAASDETLIRHRVELARFMAGAFSRVGTELHVAGHFLGDDRKTGRSPFGHGSDEHVAVSVLLRILGQLVAGTVKLFEAVIPYAAAALIRQVVEIEYLAWAFETRDGDGERWLRSDWKEREKFFAPRRIREAAQGRFPDSDYHRHCELGGHPVPGSSVLLSGGKELPQLLLTDLIGHADRISKHLAKWAGDAPFGEPIRRHQDLMRERIAEWQKLDPLAQMPPPPMPPGP